MSLDPATWSALATATNDEAVATKAAVPVTRHFLTGVSISCNGEPTAPLTIEILDGATVIERFLIPAAAFAPVSIDFRHPLRGEVNSDLSATVSAAGTDVTTAVTIRGFSVRGG